MINLAAVPRERVETELFGRGDGDVGKLIEADGGTLFLDEIGDMPLDAQTRLLRVIDGSEPAINPRTGRRPNVRVIAATNRDLRALIQQGLFREDLFFRLNVARVRLPPLRDRTEDIPDLARAFLLRALREGLPAKTIDAGGDGAAEGLCLARQCARAGEPDPPHLRPLRRGPDHRADRRAGAAGPEPGAGRARRAR